MKLALVAFAFIFVQNFAQAGDVEPESEVLVQKGRYATVTVLRGNPVRIFVAGKQRASVKNNKITLEARSQNAPLKLSRSGEYYVIDQTSEVLQAPPQIIEIRTKMPDDKMSESFKFNLKQP